MAPDDIDDIDDDDDELELGTIVRGEETGAWETREGTGDPKLPLEEEAVAVAAVASTVRATKTTASGVMTSTL